MDNKAILDELLDVLEKNGVALRHEAMGGGGSGLCKVKDRELFFVDTQSQTIETAQSCALAVNEVVDIESVYIRPEVRRFIENCIGVNK